MEAAEEEVDELGVEEERDIVQEDIEVDEEGVGVFDFKYSGKVDSLIAVA